MLICAKQRVGKPRSLSLRMPTVVTKCFRTYVDSCCSKKYSNQSGPMRGLTKWVPVSTTCGIRFRSSQYAKMYRHQVSWPKKPLRLSMFTEKMPWLRRSRYRTRRSLRLAARYRGMTAGSRAAFRMRSSMQCLNAAAVSYGAAAGVVKSGDLESAFFSGVTCRLRRARRVARTLPPHV